MPRLICQRPHPIPFANLSKIGVYIFPASYMCCLNSVYMPMAFLLPAPVMAVSWPIRTLIQILFNHSEKKEKHNSALSEETAPPLYIITSVSFLSIFNWAAWLNAGKTQLTQVIFHSTMLAVNIAASSCTITEVKGCYSNQSWRHLIPSKQYRVI